MVLTHETLACAVARHHFGPIVGEVVRVLLLRPGSPVEQIQALTYPFFDKSMREKHVNSPVGDIERLKLIKDALSVLLQHNIAYYYENLRDGRQIASSEPNRANGATDSTPKRGFRRTKTVYHIQVDNLLFRPRIPLYLGIARLRFGEVGQATIRAMFERGQLTSHQIFTSALDPILSDLDITNSDAEACLIDMVRSGILHWGGSRTLFSRVATPPSKPDFTVDGTPPAVGQKRDRSCALSEGDSDEEENGNLDRLSKGTYEKMNAGNGESAREVGAPRRENNADIWCVCFWYLNREFRNECCARVVQERVKNQLSIRILRIGLQLSLEREDCGEPSQDFESAEASADDIQRELEVQGAPATIQEFWDATQLLVDQSPAFAVAVPQHSPSNLRFNPGRLIADARQKTVDEMVLSRYGDVGRRIFRALVIEGGMEERMLAEKCMFPLKVVREHLFRMYQDRIIVNQEVPRSNEQQRSSTWYYLWKVNALSVYRNLLDVMYKTVYNLFLRLEHIDKENTVPENKEKLEARRQHLVASILRMDQSIMVMRDFGNIAGAYLPSRYTVLDGPMGKIKKTR